MTKEEQQKAADDLFDTMRAIINKSKSPDMVTDKIVARVGIVAMAGGITRTTAFGSIVFGAIYAPIVGISKETLLQMVADLYDATEMNPATPEAKATFAAANAQFHAQQTQVTQTAEDMGFDGVDDKKLLLSPMPKLKQ